MILQPGEFNVADYRKAIPWRVKLQAVLNAPWRFLRGRDTPGTNGAYVEAHPYTVDELNFDHRPALCDRPYDTDAGDFVPPQHDPAHIDAIPKPEHDRRTFGRAPDAAVTVTTRGSDVGERARGQDIRAARAVHLARLAAKDGKQAEADAILAGARFKKKDTRPKSKIPQRANAWPKGRKLGNRGNKHESRDRRNQNTGSQGNASAGKHYAANGAHRRNRRDGQVV